MGVASGCDEQEVGVASWSGWNLWVWLLGVVLRRYIDFLILLIPTPLVSVLFAAASHPYFFVHFFKMFFVLVQVQMVRTNTVMYNINCMYVRALHIQAVCRGFEFHLSSFFF